MIDDTGNLQYSKVITPAILAILAASIFFGSVVMIPQTSRGVDYRFGKMTTDNTAELRQPGMSFKVPFITGVEKVQVSQQQEDYENVTTYTKDNQIITASLSVYFKVPEDHIVDIYKSNPNWDSMLQSAVFDSYKSALGGNFAQDIAQNRDLIMKQVTEETQTKVRNLLGIEITQVMMPNFDFNKEFEVAVADAANAKAELNKKMTQLEQAKVDAQTRVVQATAESTSEKAKADGSAYAIVKNKEAEAEGFRKISDAIGQGNMSAYLYTSRWSGNVPTVMTGGGGQIFDMQALVDKAK